MLKRRTYRPLLEILEARDVPAFSVVQSGAVLKLNGSRDADIVLIEDLGANTIRIVHDDASENTYSNVNRINVNGGRGDDVVTYSVVSPSVKLWVDVRLGSGNDNFTGSITLLPEDVQETLRSRLPDDNVHRVDVDGESGSDNITLAAEGLLPEGVSFQANFRGGSHADNIFAALAGTNAGEVLVRIDGESGNDTLAAVIGRATGPASTNTGTIKVKVEGGTGKDVLNSWLGQSSGDEFNPSLGVDNAGSIDVKLDGQTGDDQINYYLGTGPAFSSQVTNSGQLNVNVYGGTGADTILLDVGDVSSTGGTYNFVNTGTANIKAWGQHGRDSVEGIMWVENSGTGVFNGYLSGGLQRDALYFQLLLAGDNSAGATGTLHAGPLDDPVLASAIVEVLHSRNKIVIPDPV
jgi:hypothetical protein